MLRQKGLSLCGEKEDILWKKIIRVFRLLVLLLVRNVYSIKTDLRNGLGVKKGERLVMPIEVRIFMNLVQ